MNKRRMRGLNQTKTGRWIVYYCDKYHGTYDTYEEAMEIRKGLEREFGLPKRGRTYTTRERRYARMWGVPRHRVYKYGWDALKRMQPEARALLLRQKDCRRTP